MKWFCIPTKASEASAPAVGDPTPSSAEGQSVPVPEAAAKKACCSSVATCLPKFPVCRKSLVLRSTSPSETETVIPAVEVSAPVAVSDQASATAASASASQ